MCDPRIGSLCSLVFIFKLSTGLPAYSDTSYSDTPVIVKVFSIPKPLVIETICLQGQKFEKFSYSDTFFSPFQLRVRLWARDRGRIWKLLHIPSKCQAGRFR
jgi:hypothetical protein